MKYGAHNIFVVIAPYGEFTEMDYTNNSASKMISVKRTKLIADAGPDLRAHRNNPVILDGTCSYGDAPIVEYEWKFFIDNQEVKLHGPQVTYVFPQSGTYNITLTVRDEAGYTATDSVTVRVGVSYDRAEPRPDAGGDRTVYIDEPVLLNGSASEDNFGIAWYAWNIDRVRGPGTDYTSRCALMEGGIDFQGNIQLNLQLMMSLGMVQK